MAADLSQGLLQCKGKLALLSVDSFSMLSRIGQQRKACAAQEDTDCCLPVNKLNRITIHSLDEDLILG